MCARAQIHNNVLHRSELICLTVARIHRLVLLLSFLVKVV